jgi:TonB-linked SusC/RagA family outer membrane protein
MKKTNFLNFRFKKLGAVFFYFFLFVEMFAQTQKITGIVTGENGEAIIGASIRIKDTYTGTVTDLNGSYSLEVMSNSTLIASYIGYKSQEILTAGRTVIDIRLQEDDQLLDEVVVVGYGTMRKRDLTGAVSSVSQEVLSGKSSALSLGNLLQGRMAGVYVFDNGGSVSYRIRGIGTVNNSSPLIVVDGVPGGIEVAPEDIESINVLKDASAAAIYGSQGANGVILINTKKGSGGNKLNVRASYNMAQIANFPKLLDASQYAALNNQILSEAGESANPDWSDPKALGKGTDWVDHIFRNAPSMVYSLSYSGGNDKSDHYVMARFSHDNGGLTIDGTGGQHLYLQANGNNQVKPWVKLGYNVVYTSDRVTGGNLDTFQAIRSLPTQRIYDDEGNFDGPSGNPLWHGTIRNQYATAKLNKNENNSHNLSMAATAEFSILNGLKFKSMGNGKLSWNITNNYTAKYPYKPVEVPDGSVYRAAGFGYTYLWDNYFTYDKKWGDDHYVNLMGGSSLNWGRSIDLGGNVKTFLKEEVHELNNARTVVNFNGDRSEWAIVSFMFRGNYSYKDRYLLTGTVRRDGSSRFGPRHRWGTFPSFSAAWRLSEENFYNKNSFLSDIKLRAGYGITGHQNIGNYSFSTGYDTGVYSFNNNVVGSLVVSRMPNPNVHWEEVHQINAGADLGFLKNRLRLTLDLYDKNTKDMLVAMQVPVSSGYNDQVPPSINAGKVNNKGIEVSVSADIISNKKLKWMSDFNIAFNKNKIISLNNDIPSLWGSVEMSGNTRINAEGHPVNSFYGFMANGLFQKQEEVNNWAVQVVGTNSTNGTAPGDIRFLDLNNDGVINDNDRTFIGNPFPAFVYALNNSLYYKDFDLSIFLQGVHGNKVYNANLIYFEAMSAAQNQFVSVLNRWQGEGTSNSVPRAVLGDPNKNARSSTRFIEDGSYLRIKDVTLGYTFPQRLSKKIALDNLRVYFEAKNLLTLSNYSGFDPEVGLNGFELGVNTVTRALLFGIDIKF